MRRWLLGMGTLLVLSLGGWYIWGLFWRIEAPIRVGILHSRTGPLAISEQSMIDAELMAIEEINQAGGLLGRNVVPVIADGRSDPKVFAEEARRLIEIEKVCVIFGCWSSISRRNVKAVVEASRHLLFFPSNYEGMDIPSGVICTGPIPNQQVIPAVNWCFDTLKARKFFLAGSKDIQSFSLNTLIKDQLKAIGAQVVGEKYIELDGTGVIDLIAAIKSAAPDLVLSTVVGVGNKPFYQQLAEAGLTPARLPVVSFTLGEGELRDLPVKDMVGDYAAWNYFQTIDSPFNRDFVRRFKDYTRKAGQPERSTSDAIVAAHNAVRLWAQAVDEAGTEATAEVRKIIIRQSLEAPEGVISVDSETLHTWRPFYLGRLRGDGQFDIVWSLEKPVRPVPFPALRSRADWQAFVEKLYAKWDTGTFDPQTSVEPSLPLRAMARRPARHVSSPSLSSSRQPKPYQR